MNNILVCIVPAIFLCSFVFAFFRKVRIYDSFTEGMKNVLPLIVSIFPYVAAITMLTKLLDASGLSAKIADWISPIFSFTGIPSEISSLVLIKPLSGGGTVAVLSDILDKYGVDSYPARCACVAYGVSDTVFYIGAVYFAGIKRKKLTAALIIALVSYLTAVIFCCFLCRIM